MMNPHDAERGADLRALLAMLRRRAAVIVLATAIGVGGALLITDFRPKRYEATAGLLFRHQLLDAQLTGLPLQLPGGDAQRTAATNLELVSLTEVRQRAAARLGPGYTAQRIEDEVEITENGKSDIVSITATEPTPEEAARVANAVAAAFVTFRRAGLRDQVVRAADKVQAELEREDLSSAVRRGLRLNLARLSLLGSVQTGDVEFVERAEPPSDPSSPKPLLWGIIGGALGFLVGLGLALLLEQLDRRVRRTDQLEDALGLPLLATVPRSKGLRRMTEPKGRHAEADREPFRRLRATLRHLDEDEGLRSVLVTSARAGSGTTTVAVHLATAAAAGGLAHVLLIEADFRRPRIAGLLDLPQDKGLSVLLTSEDPLEQSAAENIFDVPVGGGSNGTRPDGNAAKRLDVLPAGPLPDDPSELLDTDRMRGLLETARQRYDLLVIDGPPPTLVSDAIPLMTQVDGVLVVGRLGRETGPKLRELRDELDRFSVSPVGAVANFSRRVSNPYYAKSE